MTKKIYDRDPHQTRFEARVLSCTPTENGYAVILDQTAFFPEEGGQGCDRGTINGETVRHIAIDADNVLTHYLNVPFEEGTTVEGLVDWNKRFDYMQQHTGEHIFSGLVHARFGYDNVGFHLSEEYTTMDYNGSLTDEEVTQLEQEANRVITQNLPIRTFFPTKEEAAALSYRSKIEIESALRLVEIPGVDLCACCAPHVDFTGQIGFLKVIDAKSHRGGMRLTFLCGMRALLYCEENQSILSSLSATLSVPFASLTEAVDKLKEDGLSKQQRINALQEKMLTLQLQNLPGPQSNSNAILFVESMDMKAVRNAVNTLMAQYLGYSAIFTGSDAAGYSFIIGSTTLGDSALGEAKKTDCNQLAALLREKLGAKCGGSPQMIQGSVTAKESDILKIFAQ